VTILLTPTNRSGSRSEIINATAAIISSAWREPRKQALFDMVPKLISGPSAQTDTQFPAGITCRVGASVDSVSRDLALSLLRVLDYCRPGRLGFVARISCTRGFSSRPCRLRRFPSVARHLAPPQAPWRFSGHVSLLVARSQGVIHRCFLRSARELPHSRTNLSAHWSGSISVTWAIRDAPDFQPNAPHCTQVYQ
jgi:hypothetical protein